MSFSLATVTDETRRLFLEQRLAAHAGQSHQAEAHEHDGTGFGDGGGMSGNFGKYGISIVTANIDT